MAIRTFHHTAFKRAFVKLFYCAYKNSKKFFKRKILIVKPAPLPENIIWQNMETSSGSLLIRSSLSLIFTLLIFVLVFMVQVWIETQREDRIKKYPIIDCGDTIYSKEEVISDYLLGDNRKNYLECYCMEDLAKRQNEYFNIEGKEKKLCQSMLTEKLTIQYFSYLAVFIIFQVNFIMDKLFDWLTELEAHRSLSQKIASNSLKTFIAEFFNTGFIVLLVNAKLTEANNQMFRGKFDDFNPLWYSTVGVTFLYTMIISVISGPIMSTFWWLYKRFWQCLDRGCKKELSKENTKKEYQHDWNTLYTGPDFNLGGKYIQILVVLYVCFMYGSALPLLYIVTFVYLLSRFWQDKFKLLGYCRNPINIDERLELMVRRAIFFGIMFHLVYSIYFFGNTDIFEYGNDPKIENSQDDDSKAIDEAFSDTLKENYTYFQDVPQQLYFIRLFFHRMWLPQNLLSTFVLIIMLIYMLTIGFIITPVEFIL